VRRAASAASRSRRRNICGSCGFEPLRPREGPFHRCTPHRHSPALAEAAGPGSGATSWQRCSRVRHSRRLRNQVPVSAARIDRTFFD
jgi:hypothetical protein